MDMFMTRFQGEVDLDDVETYRSEFFQIHKKVCELRSYAWSEIGKSLVYMDYLNPHIAYEAQRKRVVKFAEEFADERFNHGQDTKENRRWWQKFVFKLMWETENQC